MMGQGLAAFSRYFYPQIEKKALVVDIRNNGGGFVSQMIIQRLGREVWAFMKPRHGQMGRYPAKSLYGHLAVLIDQHAGSDGDVFPESFRIKQLGPLIGTRTWGGVVGIRADKPFVDFGLSTQPEFAWWEPKRGWSLENEGVTPDIEVDITPNDRIAGRDPQFRRPKPDDHVDTGVAVDERALDAGEGRGDGQTAAARRRRRRQNRPARVSVGLRSTPFARRTGRCGRVSRAGKIRLVAR